MTNSTDKTANEANTSKKKKAKGPIRFEAIVPAAIFMGLIIAYFVLFFDSHLKWALEWGATQANGAEVNIGEVDTSFTAPSFHMRRIQITDKNNPERNLFEVGEVNFGLLWDALLRAKVVVDEASILNIQALTPRSRPGHVIPPSEGPSGLKELENQVLEQTKEEFDQNILGDVANVIDGVKPEEQLKNIENELKASIRIKELETELKEKERLWRERIEALPQGKDIKALEERLKALKFDTKNPAQFAASLKKAEAILKEADQKIKLVDQTGKDLRSDVTNYNQAIKGLDELVKQDLKDLQNRLNIPDLNTKDFTTQLLGGMFRSKLIELQKYMAIAREYMPPKKTEEEKQAEKAKEIIPPPRGVGKDYRFPITKGYPIFWLKHAAITSELGQSEYSGNIKGEIIDLTSNPPLIGKPTLLRAEGDFPKQKIFDFKGLITIDHTTETPREDLMVSVGAYPLGKQKISDSSDVRFIIEEATAQAVLNARLENQQLNVTLDNQFKDLKYDIDSKTALVKEILTTVMAGIPTITLNARARGTWSRLDLGMNSNLGAELSKGFKAQLDAKVAEAKAKIQGLINDKIGAERAKLNAEFDKIKGQVNSLVDSKKGEIDKAKQQAENQFKEEKNKGQAKELKKLEEEGKKLLKGLGF